MFMTSHTPVEPRKHSNHCKVLRARPGNGQWNRSDSEHDRSARAGRATARAESLTSRLAVMRVAEAANRSGSGDLPIQA
ncbi:unnamed protein product [Boreogadus saida]